MVYGVGLWCVKNVLIKACLQANVNLVGDQVNQLQDAETILSA